VEAKQPIDDKVSATIKNLIDKYGDRPDRKCRYTKEFPLKIGKKWKGIASCCVRVIKEKIPQQDQRVRSYWPCCMEKFLSLKKEAVDAIDEDSRKDVEEIKLYLDLQHVDHRVLSTPVERSEPEDKVIKFWSIRCAYRT
jgi:hypothetical protein